MSANIEHALISQIVDSKDFHTLQKLQIDEGFFTSPEVREIYRFIRDTYFNPSTHGEVPSREMIKLNYPAFMFAPSHDSVSVLCSHLRRERMRAEFLKLAQELEILAEKDPAEALAAIKSESAKLAALSEAGQDMPMSSVYNTLLDRYESVQNSNGLLGIPYPWDQLNEETQGMQEGQFIVLYGRPKSMKTWIGIYIAIFAYVRSRKRVLFYSREMAPIMIAQRAAAALAGVDYKAFKNGTLQPELKAKVFTILKELLDDEKAVGINGAKNACFVITSDRSAASGGGGGGVAWLQAKIRDLKPDLVVVDGMYLMKDDRSGQRSVDWKAIAHISQDLKLTAQEFGIPVIGITQANRAADKSKGEDLTELAFSDSLGQDADAVFRVSKKDRIGEDNIRRTELMLTAPGLREGRFDGIVIQGEPATDFTYLRTLLDSDQEEQGEYGSKKPAHTNGVPKPGFKGSMRDPKIPLSTVKSKK